MRSSGRCGKPYGSQHQRHSGDVNFIKDRMLTKDDVRSILGEELRDLRSDVKAIYKNPHELKETITGYRKEIDHALERIAAIRETPRPRQEDRGLTYAASADYRR